MSQPQISIVSPVYKCESCLEALVERTHHALTPLNYEVIFVDDASPDNSWSKIEELVSSPYPVRGIRLARNFGQHAAISAGLQAAVGSVVVVIDCDLQDRPEEIPRLLAALHSGADIALAQRENRQDTLGKRLSSSFFYRTLGWLTNSRYDHSTANFGAYSRRAVDAFNSMPESERFFPLLMRWTGLETRSIPVEHSSRLEGKTSYNLKKLLRLAFHIALSFSEKPLRAVVVTALLFAAASLTLAVVSIMRYIAGDIQVAGFTSIVASIWLVGSAMLASIGVVGLYVGRIFTEVKNRPNYIVAKSRGFDSGVHS